MPNEPTRFLAMPAANARGPVIRTTAAAVSSRNSLSFEALMTHLSRRFRAAALFVAAPSALTGAAWAADAPPIRDFETRFRFVESASGAYPATGCLDHRALMFIVRETAGDDPAAAKLRAGRDCRPLVPGADYLRCGPGGWAYPTGGERISYASYCRLGAQDLPLYVLDSQMQPAGNGNGDGVGRPR
jgi:hypothetical protein